MKHALPVISPIPNGSSQSQVQERALQSVPDLCESIDYAEVQGVLFPRVAVRASITLVYPLP